MQLVEERLSSRRDGRLKRRLQPGTGSHRNVGVVGDHRVAAPRVDVPGDTAREAEHVVGGTRDAKPFRTRNNSRPDARRLPAPRLPWRPAPPQRDARRKPL